MTTPVIATTGLTSLAATASPWSINLPASIAAGDLLLGFLANHSSNTITVPTNWTSLLNLADGTFVFYKFASGAEGATVSITSTGGSSTVAAAVYRITGSDGVTAPAIANTAVASGTNYDPPSLTPSWGAATTLWFAVASNNSNAATVSVAPTSYSAQNNQASGGAGAAICDVHVYVRANTTATENPSAFTLSTGSVGEAVTVGICPAGLASTYFFNQPMLGM